MAYIVNQVSEVGGPTKGDVELPGAGLDVDLDALPLHHAQACVDALDFGIEFVLGRLHG